MKYPFTIDSKKIIVTPFLQGNKNVSVYNFILDTGAGTTVIDESVANFLGYDKENTKTEIFVSAGGRVSGQMIKLPQINLFGETIPNFEVSIMKLPLQITLYADGLIGMDFLTRFKHFKINFENDTIEV